MKTTALALVVVLAAPYLAGCFRPLPVPLPAPQERGSTEIVGVVRDNGEEGGERILFTTVMDVSWTDTSLSIVGVPEEPGADAGPNEPLTRTFPLSDLSGVLTRQLDVNRTSLLVAGVALSLITTVALFIFNERTGGAS